MSSSGSGRVTLAMPRRRCHRVVRPRAPHASNCTSHAPLYANCTCTASRRDLISIPLRTNCSRSFAQPWPRNLAHASPSVLRATRRLSSSTRRQSARAQRPTSQRSDALQERSAQARRLHHRHLHPAHRDLLPLARALLGSSVLTGRNPALTFRSEEHNASGHLCRRHGQRRARRLHRRRLPGRSARGAA